MVYLSEFVLLLLAIVFSLVRLGFANSQVFCWIHEIAAKRRLVIATVGATSFLGCIAVACLVHEPVPRVHDEFSYLVMSNTFASGHVANPPPPVPHFFDTFHVLVRPVYASKYFPAQGLFLAVGEKLTGHPAVGVWLSSAVACAAICWMLQAWIGITWALLGSFLMVVQFGIFSYWSQTYWGGMVAAIGGALFFGAARRLCESISWENSLGLVFGLLLLANSRPLEGAIAALPITGLFLTRAVRKRRWKESVFWLQLVLPIGSVLILGAAGMGAYNRAITGSSWKPPYLLHEQQYQESPQFTFLPLRPKITYSSVWLQYYYEVDEMRLYMSQRTPAHLMITAARKMVELWHFYCGLILSTPLVLPALLRRGWIRHLQMILLAGFTLVSLLYDPGSVAERAVIDILSVTQIGLLWVVFDGLWQRLATATCVLLILESVFVKYAFPHYFAPTACLVLFLQVDGLRRLWYWNPSIAAAEGKTRTERRRMLQREQNTHEPVSAWRGFVVLLPLVVVISLGIRVTARINEGELDGNGPDRQALLIDDWSLRRAELQHWLQQQPNPQLVFVRYFPSHSVISEWVYNHADIMHSHVIWARDLGTDQNRLLLDLLKDRTVWLLDADQPQPQLIPYPEGGHPVSPASAEPLRAGDGRLPW